MTDAIASAQSALNAMSVTMAAAAGNMANLNTDGYKAQSVDLATAADGAGVTVEGVRTDTSSGSLRPDSDYTVDISDAGRAMTETSNVDPVRESVTMIGASRAFEANVTVIRTQDAMTGALLDMLV